MKNKTEEFQGIKEDLFRVKVNLDEFLEPLPTEEPALKRRVGGFFKPSLIGQPVPEKIIIYRSNYGMPLGRWDRLMNRLWYHSAEKERLWAKLVYYPLDYVERLAYRLNLIGGQ